IKIYTQTHQITDLGAGATPLFPVAHPNTAANPTIQIGDVVELAGQTEVAYPTSQVTIEVSQTTLHRNSSAAAGKFFDTPLEGFQLLRCDLVRHALTHKSESQELTPLGRPHAALLLVDHKLQTFGEVTLDRREYPLGT